MSAPSRVVAMAFAAAAIWLVLALPDQRAALTPAGLARMPLEVPAILFGAMALSARRGAARLFAGTLAAMLVAVLLLKGVDYGVQAAFSRRFDPVLDTFIFPAALNLLTGAVGPVAATLAIAAAVLVALALAWLFRRAVSAWSVPLPRRGRHVAGAVALTCVALAAAETGRELGAWRLPAELPGTSTALTLIARHVADGREAARDLATFRRAARSDPWAGRGDLLDRLDGRDVTIMFVESYGRASFDNPLYSGTHATTLRAAERDLDAAGLAARSLWLTSPIAGGQSWLAHATLASGLPIGDQARYAAMLASPRRTLFHLARQSGYRSSAVMPAITMTWPEGTLMGFDPILAADDLGYDGLPFNWVTMPDQYTLAAYPPRLGDGAAPDFTQVALISSHAPWTPIPRMIDWETARDGRAFDDMAQSGDTPRQVWSDRDEVRDHYRRAVDYALEAAMAFAARSGGADAPLLFVLGDHQPAAFVAQVDSRDVPLHVIGPPEVLDRIADWDATPGLVPAPDAPVWPMSAFRDRFLDTFTSPREGT